ncbi:MAG: DUF4160 domain-containing protein [Firmicutes bacterium]|jgi:hypothetical protein|uniref:DUF4160 domain-containing protein n=1 Tax=Thomasclavelia cocleata TaxID=69824 RepID=UPI00272E747E|nr:DUF4160 domain-containing protein [Thomasclavelia cocleata]MCI9355903.1 DUF4160 domain-containing protein [Bacillota bacterium]
MPNVLTFMGYHIYFWANENGEPVHVHIAKGKPTANATKVWITSSGDTVLEHNKSKIPSSDLKKVLSYVRANVRDITGLWCQMFGVITYKY